MGGKNYLPSNILEFQALVHNVQAKVGPNQTKWGISTGAYSSLTVPILAFDNTVKDYQRKNVEPLHTRFQTGKYVEELLIKLKDEITALYHSEEYGLPEIINPKSE
jgi:uncharacterized radical SAM superfamily protein